MDTAEGWLTIRPADAADAEAIGEISVLAWRAAYEGLMPAAYLDALDPDERAARWIDGLTSPPARSSVIIGEDLSRAIGFAAVGPCDGSERVGELYALNLRPDCWRTGVGSTLLRESEQILRTFGFTEAVLWVLPGNQRARRFYEARGWRHEGLERDELVHDITVRETRYTRLL